MTNPLRPWDLMEACAVGSQDIFVAAPYIKHDTLARLLNLVDRDCSLICVSRWRRREIACGVSDRESRELVVERGGEFRLHQSMHAKYYRFGDVVLTGSANLTGAGMGYSPWPNLEILCFPGEGFIWQQMEDRLLSESYLVDDAEYLRWEGIEVTDERLGLSGRDWGPSEPESAGWEPLTRDPNNLWLAYSGLAGDIPGDDERRAALTDLDKIGFPVGLDREGFDSWILGALLESPWVGRIRSLWGADRMEVRSLLEVEWGMDPSSVERSRQTLESWIMRYLANL